MSNSINVSALTWEPNDTEMLIVADKEGKMFLVKRDGTILKRYETQGKRFIEAIIFVPSKVGYFMTVNQGIPAFREWQVSKLAHTSTKKIDKPSITNAIAMLTDSQNLKNFNGDLMVSYGDGSLSI